MTINSSPIGKVLKVNSREIINKIFIYNYNGALITTVEDNFSEIDVSNLTQGIYTIMIKTNNGIVNSKFQKG